MEFNDLNIAILITIYTKRGKSKTAHYPGEYICKRFPSHQRGKVKKRIEKLHRKGYLSLKPHPSGLSYGLSDEGWKVAKELEAETS